MDCDALILQIHYNFIMKKPQKLNFKQNTPRTIPKPLHTPVGPIQWENYWKTEKSCLVISNLILSLSPRLVRRFAGIQSLSGMEGNYGLVSAVITEREVQTQENFPEPNDLKLRL